MRAADEERATLNESLIARQSEAAQTHSSGFEAWMRSRTDIKARLGPVACHAPLLLLRCALALTLAHAQIYTGDDIAEEFGVEKSSYDAVVLPGIKAYQARRSPVLRLGRAR
jgi:hypothetical protein